MAPPTIVSTLSMIKLSLNSLDSPIFGPGSVTFIDDTQAYTTVDIN